MEKELWLEGKDEKRISIMENFLKNTFHQKLSKPDSEAAKQAERKHSIALESWDWRLTSQEYSERVDEIKEWRSKNGLLTVIFFRLI